MVDKEILHEIFDTIFFFFAALIIFLMIANAFIGCGQDNNGQGQGRTVACDDPESPWFNGVPDDPNKPVTFYWYYVDGSRQEWKTIEPIADCCGPDPNNSRVCLRWVGDANCVIYSSRKAKGKMDDDGEVCLDN